MLNPFSNARYIALETFRRNGEGVKTTVWFVERNGKFYVWTIRHSGKAKRIGLNPKVRIAPSTVSGKRNGDWADANARILGELRDDIIHLMRTKYTLQFWLLQLIHGRGRVLIEIEPLDQN